MMTHLIRSPISLDDLLAEVQGPERGGTCLFLGTVRNDEDVTGIEYSAYDDMALGEITRILNEAQVRWPDARVTLRHRLGLIPVGEASIAIAAASPHRGNAYAACRYAIERVKQIAPIWKKEYFDGGDVWIEGATADPDEAGARAEAERVACG